MPDQIREEHHGAVQEGDDDEVAPGEVSFDLPGQFAHAFGELGLRDQNGLHFTAQAARDAASRLGRRNDFHLARERYHMIVGHATALSSTRREAGDMGQCR